jgi:GcrA cell cycle regulator
MQANVDLQGACGSEPGLLAFKWTEQSIAIVKKRWGEGASASTIARQLGVSRCAVLGKIHRLKLPQPAFERRHPDKERRQRRRRRPLADHNGSDGAGRSSNLAALFDRLLDRAFPRPGAAGDAVIERAEAHQAFGPACTLVELDGDTCRWPVGDPGTPQFAFCGAAPFGSYPYCRAHCGIAYRPNGKWIAGGDGAAVSS